MLLWHNQPLVFDVDRLIRRLSCRSMSLFRFLVNATHQARLGCVRLAIHNLDCLIKLKNMTELEGQVDADFAAQ